MTDTGSGRRPWDVALTLVLLLLMLVVAGLLAFAGLFLSMSSDPCGASVTCDTTRISAGVLIATFGPIAVAVAGVIVSVTRLTSGRIAFWVPIVAAGVAVLVLIGGAELTFSGVPSS